jgi:phosphotransferase system HPr (HPr) family protein
MSPNSETAQCAELSVTLPANLHARPAGALTRTAATFESDVQVGYNGREVNAASVLGVMTLGATKGATVTITADGPDAEAAVQAIAEVLASAE